MRRSRYIQAALCGLFAFVLAARVTAQASPPSATTATRYVIHQLERPIGEERDEITRNAGGVALSSALDYIDRGGRIQLSASLGLGADLTPFHFEAKGKTYRFVNLDSQVDVRERRATIRNFAEASTVDAPTPFFTARGYAPLAARALLIEYWGRHGRPREITLLPDGSKARIVFRGVDVVKAGARAIRLKRYSVDGVVWGQEAVWIDEANQLAALFTRIHILPLEAVREDLLESFAPLQARALEDRMADIATLRAEVKPLAEGTYALIGARVLDGTTHPPIDDATVLVRDGRIAAVGSRASIPIAKAIRHIDAAGKTIIPGLWDMHGHLGQVEWGPAYLAAGVTTARDVGGERRYLTAFRDALSSGRGLGPRLLLAGLVDGGGPEGYGTTIANTAAEGRTIVGAYKSAGFNQMKLYSRLAPEVVLAITERAHQVGMTVTGHIPVSLQFRQAIESGMDQFEHLAIRGEPGSSEVQETAQFLARRGTVAGPTVSWDELLGRDPGTAIESFEPGILEAPIPLRSSYTSVRNDVDRDRAQASRRRGLGLIKALHDAGVRVVAGTDGALPGHSLLHTLELFVEAGMTPTEAIASATSVPAKFMKVDGDVGTIEAGKRADLLILDADPLTDISNVRRGHWVISNGRMLECATLWKSVGFTPALTPTR